MRGNASRVLAGILIATTAAHAAVTIPADKRMPATVVAHLSAPPTDPMHMPTDVAVDSAGRAFVADGARNRIVRFTPQGAPDSLLTEWGGQRLNQPVGLTVDAAGQLWIADSGNHRLLVVSGEGKLVQIIELPKSPKGLLADPTDVALAPQGKRVYVVDGQNNRILVSNDAAGPWTPLEQPVGPSEPLERPFMICVDPEGVVNVSEALGAKVQRISPTGQRMNQVGQWGIQVGQLHRPKGVAADARCRVFVSDSTLGVVQAFDSKGRVEGVLTDADGTPLRFSHPMGMCFDSAGRLYVVELGANRVAVVSLGQGTATAPVGGTGSKSMEGSR